MKIGWGTGVAAGFALFVILILVLVGISLTSPTDVVTDHYYEKGLHYQKEIVALQRTAARGEKLAIRMDGKALILRFPRRILNSDLNGTITLYRPSDRNRDIFLPVRTDTTGTQLVSLAGVEQGFWKLQVRWREGEEDLYHEQPLMVQ